MTNGLVDWVIVHADGTEEGNVVGKFLDEREKTRRREWLAAGALRLYVNCAKQSPLVATSRWIIMDR